MNYKILLSNVGYYTGLNGAYLNYILGFYRYIYKNNKTELKILNKIKKLIKMERPDICCLLEINPNHIKALKNKKYLYSDCLNKYGGNSLISKLPFLSKNCNGILAKKNIKTKKHFLKNGAKKLVYEIQINKNTSLFAVHLSLNKQTRKKQFEEIKTLTADKPNIIICGDFNIFDGLGELEPLLRDKRLKVINTKNDKTFPAFKPKKILDIFICSKNIKIKKLHIPDTQYSDHLPIIVDCIF